MLIILKLSNANETNLNIQIIHKYLTSAKTEREVELYYGRGLLIRHAIW